MVEPVLAASTLASAVATSAAKAITSIAVQASAPAWKSVVNSSVFESRKIKKLGQWDAIRNHRKQSRELSRFLNGRLCLGLIEAYAISYATSLLEPAESAGLEEQFCRELGREVTLQADSQHVAIDLWQLLTSIVKLSLKDLKTNAKLNAGDLVFFAQLTQEQDGASALTKAINERRQVSSSDQRARLALNLAHAVQQLGTEAFSEILMPHARESYRVGMHRLYVPRDLLPQPIDWRANRGPHEFDRKDMVLIHEEQVAERRFVLIGSPGAGKSTYIRRLLLRTSVEAATCIAPLVLELKNWTEQSGSLVDMLAARLRVIMQIEVDPTVLADLLSLGVGLVVFDGLDEVVDVNQRRTAVQAIEAFARRYPLVRVVATSRREGYDSAPLSALMFPAYRIPDFNHAQMEQYVRQWFSLVATFDDVDGDGQALAESFVIESIHAADLRFNPLMLSLLCLLYQYEGYIPSNRARVYEECAELLFGRWDRIRKVGNLVKRDARGHHLIEQIAMHMYRRQDSQGGETERVLKLVIQQYLRANVIDDEFRASEEADDFLQHCSNRAWLLTKIGTTPRGEQLFGFSHRTFMEYFASCYLARHASSPEDFARELVPIIESGSGELIVQLAVDRFGERVYDGVDDTLRTILFGSKTLIHRYHSRYLPFVVRSLEFLSPKPITVRAILLTALRDHYKNSGDWSRSCVSKLPKKVSLDFDKLCNLLSESKAEPATREEGEATEGARMLTARVTARNKDVRWLRRYAPDVLTALIMSQELSVSAYLRSAGSGALVDIVPADARAARVTGPLVLAMREAATSGYINETLEQMLKALIATPRYLFPMSPDAVIELAEQIDGLNEWHILVLFGAQRSIRHQTVGGFTQICAATALEAMFYGLREEADIALRCGFGEEWRIEPSTVIIDIWKLICDSPFIELTDTWKQHIARRYKDRLPRC